MHDKIALFFGAQKEILNLEKIKRFNVLLVSFLKVENNLNRLLMA